MNITPYEKNQKKHPKKQVQQIANSIKEFGMNQQIVVDKEGVIIVGHGRYEALKLLGWEIKDEWIKVLDVTEEQAKAYRLADNKLNESDWEMDLVIAELKELDEANFDITLTGFENDLIIEPEEKDDEVPELPEEPTAKLGEIYQLGEHRLMCGSATEKVDVDNLFGKSNPYVELVFTDPPYGMDLDTDYSKMGGAKYTPVIGDQEEFDMKPVMELVDTKKWYIWGADYLYKTIQDYGLGNLIVWSKRQSEAENKVFGSAFELCWVYPKQKKEVWFVRGINQSAERLGAHPTQKPTELASRAITRDTEEGESVYDAFGGSGSTLIAAEKLNRKCYMMELDPKYVDVIIKRWEDYTGNKAKLVV